VYQVLALPPAPLNALSREERFLKQRQASLAYLKKLQAGL
jgi:hypothetical protein